MSVVGQEGPRVCVPGEQTPTTGISRDPAGAADQWFGQVVVHSGGKGVISRCPNPGNEVIPMRAGPSALTTWSGFLPLGEIVVSVVVRDLRRLRYSDLFAEGADLIPGEGVVEFPGFPQVRDEYSVVRRRHPVG